ncbi:MAG: Kelch repeat-containing protein [Methanomassiliicoccales archaeon]
MFGKIAIVFLLTLTLLSGAIIIPGNVSASVPGWDEETAMPTGNTAFAYCKLLDGRVFLFGGYDHLGMSSFNEAYIYDPADLTWTPISSGPMALMGCSAEAMPDGRVYVFGGNYPQPLQEAMIYDVATDSWSLGTSSTPHRPWSVETVALNETTIMLVGGQDISTGTVYTLCYIYDTVTDEFSPANQLPSPRAGGTLIRDEDRLYYIGGYDNSFTPSSNIFVYDIQSESWQYYADLPSPLVGMRAVLAADGLVYMVGGSVEAGFADGGSSSVSMLSLIDLTVHDAPAVPMRTRNCGLVELNSGELFAFGGNDDKFDNFMGYVIDLWSKNAWISNSTVGVGGSVRVYVDVDVYQHGPASLFCSVSLLYGDVVLDSMMFHAERGFTASVLLNIPSDAVPGSYTIVLESVITETSLGYGEFDFQEFEVNVTSAASLQDQVDDLQQDNQELREALDGKLDSWVGYVLLVITVVSLLAVLMLLLRRK